MTLFPNRRWPRPRRLALLLVATLLLAAYLARSQLLLAMGRFLDVSERPRPVDVVLVLGGGANQRPFVAAALFRAGLARRVLVPTVKLNAANEEDLYPPEHELIRRVLESRGVPPERVVPLPEECNSTLDEALALARFLDAEPETTVAVVTHDFHTRRARSLFRRVLGGRIARVHFVSAPTEDFSADDWWCTAEGFATYTTEYLKLVLYTLR
jgi:uncharacterized SAM-binding protein YcdF (DUF218 family)